MIGVFVSARLGSTRLPEKHLIEVNQKPLIKWLVERFLIEFREEINNNEIKIFITTSTKPENQKFNFLFEKDEVNVFFGSDENIPLRHLECAIENNIDHIISIDGDDILCSTKATKIIIEKLLNGSKMVQTSGLPLGMNVMGYSKEFLKQSLQGIEISKLETGWGKIFNNKDIDIIEFTKNPRTEKIRLTLDYPEDEILFKNIITKIDVLNVSDEVIIETILSKNWNLINSHLDEIYWKNFSHQKEKEN
jgi:spore coat polysaccharide biosynthesis protein SpsF (cytidylyltransferase family)